MRNAFLSAVVAVASLFVSMPEADAASSKPQTSVRKQAVKKSTPVPVGDCTPEKKEGRVRADVLFEMKTGDILSSTLYNTNTGEVIKTDLSDDELKKTVIHPASLTKLESVMEMMRRVFSGEWAKDKVVGFFFKKKTPTNLTLGDLAVASLNPSANVMDHPQIATPEFIQSMNAYMKAHGRENTTYLNNTGYPTDAKVRAGHLTTLHDLIVGIRDFELNYATPEKTRAAFGLDKITGLWEIDVPGLKRVQHTIKVMESADARKGHPIKGVVSGKSGTTCNFGSGAYLTYQFNKDYTFGLLTVGHDKGAIRDAFIERSLEDNKTMMAEFVRKASTSVIPEVVHKPLPTALNISSFIPLRGEPEEPRHP